MDDPAGSHHEPPVEHGDPAPASEPPQEVDPGWLRRQPRNRTLGGIFTTGWLLAGGVLCFVSSVLGKRDEATGRVDFPQPGGALLIVALVVGAICLLWSVYFYSSSHKTPDKLARIDEFGRSLKWMSSVFADMHHEAARLQRRNAQLAEEIGDLKIIAGAKGRGVRRRLLGWTGLRTTWLIALGFVLGIFGNWLAQALWPHVSNLLAP